MPGRYMENADGYPPYGDGSAPDWMIKREEAKEAKKAKKRQPDSNQGEPRDPNREYEFIGEMFVSLVFGVLIGLAAAWLVHANNKSPEEIFEDDYRIIEASDFDMPGSGHSATMEFCPVQTAAFPAADAQIWADVKQWDDMNDDIYVDRVYPVAIGNDLVDQQNTTASPTQSLRVVMDFGSVYNDIGNDRKRELAGELVDVLSPEMACI